MAMILILLGAVFVFILGKGNMETPRNETLTLIGERGSKSTNGILIAIAAFSIGTSIAYFSMRMHTRTRLDKASKIIMITSFVTSTLASLIMLVMSMLDIIGVWSIWPWLINFGLLTNFAWVLFAFKLTLNPKVPKAKILQQIDFLKENEFLTSEEYKTIKERAKSILKINDTKESTNNNKKADVKEEEIDIDKIIKKKTPAKKSKTEKEIEKEQIRLAKAKVHKAKEEFNKTVKK